ncbi:MAG: hypothetical protein JWO05_3739 [Gemmatimonadetes bacterium]|nr:hypothetical protein [Gemmatimonadota bacterium]
MTRRRWWALALSIAVLALLSSFTSLRNGFTYDDIYIIQQNPKLHALGGWWRLFGQTYWTEAYGGDGYRPMTMLFFTLEWAAGKGAPLVFHIANVLMYVALSVSVFWLAGMLLPEAGAWIAAAFFAVHPVHVEAVANTVGQSELLVGLALTLATGLYIRDRQRGPLTMGTAAGICALFAAALFAKEHAIVLPGLIVVAELLAVPRDEAVSLRRRAVALRPLMLVMVLVAAAYLLARSRVLAGGLSGFAPYVPFQSLKLSNGNRILTMFGAAPQWIRLLFWPETLRSEYAPPLIDMAEGPSLLQLPGVLMIFGLLALAIACWKRHRPVAFGIGWFVVALSPVSNFFIPAGFIIAERTLLLPSVGFVIAVAYGVSALVARMTRDGVPARRVAGWTTATVVLLLALGVVRSATRAPVWKDNDTFFRQAVIDAPDSYRANYMLGAWLFQLHRKSEGEVYYRRALKLFPYDPFMAYNLAEQYRAVGICEPAEKLYRWAWQLDPFFNKGRAGLAWCLLVNYKFDEAKHEALEGIRSGGNVRQLRALIHTADSAKAGFARHGIVLDSTGKLPERWRNASAPVVSPGSTKPLNP